jgi:hypothetical protein
LRAGDFLDGTILSLSRDAGCKIQEGEKKTTVPLSQLAAVLFNTELLARRQPKGLYGHLVLRNGCRLSLAAAEIDPEGTIKGKTTFGAAILAPLESLAALDLRQGSAVYLSDLPYKEYHFTPFLGATWPLVTDASVTGHSLRLGDSTLDKGLGMHAESRVTYELAGQHDRFEALVGLDARSGRRGTARIEILVDGKPQPLKLDKELTGAGPPAPIRVDVRGARLLTLVVKFGRRGDVQSHVNWADARLIKAR